LDWTLDTLEEGVATGALEDLSADARYYGKPWAIDAVPDGVKSMVLRAAARFMRNVDGFIQSRAGDESVSWAEAETLGTAEFTDDEQKRLSRLAKANALGFGTISTFAWQTKDAPEDIWVPVQGRGIDLPLYAAEDVLGP